MSQNSLASTTQDDPWTIGRLLAWTQQYLTQRSAESPRLDAEVLLAFARGCKRIELYTAFDELASDELRTTFRELVRRRAGGTPVAYLVGSKEFYSLPFRVTPDVLIPRPETEFLVIRALDLIKALRQSVPSRRQIRVLDVGTGSGIVAICIAVHAATVEVSAVDVSDTALDVARGNANTHGVGDRVRFLRSDLLQEMPPEETFDLIISNPPYVSTSEFEQLPIEVREHEPRLALLAGALGTEVIHRLITQSASRLSPGGSFVVEVSPMIAHAVEEMLTAIPTFTTTRITKDLEGRARVVEAQAKLT